MLILRPILRRLITVVIVLAIPLVVAEFIARRLIGSALASALTGPIGARPAVAFGSRPLLLELVRGSLTGVRIHAAALRIGDLPPVAVDGTLDDVHLGSLVSLTGVVGSIALAARVPPSVVGRLVGGAACTASLPVTVLEQLTANPRVLVFPGRVDLLPPAGRAAEVRLQPRVAAGVLRFAVSGVDVAGVPVSAGELAGVQAAARCAHAVGPAPLHLRLVGANAGAGLLTLRFRAHNTSFSPLS